MVRAILSTICMLLMVSCSVKEPRGECPCYLNLNFDDIIAAGEFGESLVSVASGAMASHENVKLAAYEGVGYELKVPRRLVHAALSAGIRKAARRGDTLVYSAGMETDALYAWHSDLDCDDDLKFVRPHLHKQYCKLVLDIVGSDDDCDLVLNAGCNAMAMLGLRPLPGDYSVELRKDGQGRYVVMIPRQRDSWVRLDFIQSCTGQYTGKGEAFSSFDVGAGMAASGYDWSKEDLDDAMVTVDLIQAKVSVRIMDWESENLEINI